MSYMVQKRYNCITIFSICFVGHCIAETKRGVKLTLVRTEITRNASISPQQLIFSDNDKRSNNTSGRQSSNKNGEQSFTNINFMKPSEVAHLSHLAPKSVDSVQLESVSVEKVTNLNYTVSKPSQLNKDKVTLKRKEASSDKGERRTDVYQVNNGMLLSRPRKVITLTGVKKSFEPVPPGTVNYHVIKKSNVTAVNDIMMNNKELLLGMTHLRRRSLIELNKNNRSDTDANTKKDRALSLVNLKRTLLHNQNKKNGIPCYTINIDLSKRKLYDLNSIKRCKMNAQSSSDLALKTRQIISRLKEIKPEELPLLKQKHQHIRKALSRARNNQRKLKHFRTTEPDFQTRGIIASRSKIEPIDNIKKDMGDLDIIIDYPRFPISNFAGKMYPRFRDEELKLIEFPRFPISKSAMKEFPLSPISRSRIKEYPRFPIIKSPLKEFPRFPLVLKRYPEPPGIPEIKPLQHVKRNQVRSHYYGLSNGMTSSKLQVNSKMLRPAHYWRRIKEAFEGYDDSHGVSSEQFLKGPEVQNTELMYTRYNTKQLPKHEWLSYSEPLKSNSKRYHISHINNFVKPDDHIDEQLLRRRVVQNLLSLPNVKRNRLYSDSYDEYNDDYDNYQSEDDNADNNGIPELERDRISDAYGNYEPIGKIHKIPHIAAPPAIPGVPEIPNIPDIPGIPSIPEIKGIPSLPFIKPIKPIPPAKPRGDGKSITTSPKNLATVDSQPVSAAGDKRSDKPTKN